MILDGTKLSKNIYKKLKKKIDNSSKKLTLGVILVGNDISSIRYIKQKKKWADYVGIGFVLKKLPKDVKEDDLLSLIGEFNKSEKITGFIIQLPLPKHINDKKIIESISPEKDVDGFHPINQGKLLIGDNSGFIPCTPSGIMEFFKQENIKFSGKHVVVIGRSNIVGKPITNLLINAGATVTSCNSKTIDLTKFTISADIIIVAAGKPGLLKASMLKHGSIIIDVGFTVIDGKIYGDCETKNIELMGNKITPVPGGVGALTVAMLIKNTLKAGGII